MSLRRDKLIAFLGVLFVTQIEAQDPFTFCKDDTCGDCPVSVTSIGTGYPDCAIYNSDDVFANQGFLTTAKYCVPPARAHAVVPSALTALQSDISAFIDIPQQDESAPCYIIFKSPASAEAPGCGAIQKSFQDATCGSITLEDTFMVQFCCGRDDCSAAGIINLPPRQGAPAAAAAGGSFARSASGGVRSLRLAVNGTEIKPAYLGPPLAASHRRSRRAVFSQRADGVCDGKWAPVAGKEDYTRPADGAQIVSGLYTGPVDVAITTERTQSWSTTIETSLGFADILSLGVSFSSEFSESLSNSEAATYPIPEGEEGYVVWTSYVRCSQGSGICNGQEISGEVCTPYVDQNSKKLAGEYALVQQG